MIFLAGVAAALTYADLRPAAIIALMAAAWAVVALLEWTAWLDEPHYGRGLPPRYYVPHVALPPPLGVEQGEPYPVLPAVDDEPTFIASTQEWAIDVANWPELRSAAMVEDTIAHPAPALDEDGVTIVPLPPLIPEIEETVALEVLVPEEDEDTAEDAEEERVPVVEIVEAVVTAAVVVEPAPEQAEEPLAKPVPVPPPRRTELPMPARVTGTALHRVDPLVQSRRRRLFSRGRAEGPAIEVRDGPPPERNLPSRVLEESGRR